MNTTRVQPLSVLGGFGLAAALFLATGMRPAPSGVTSEQLEILRHMSLVKIPDGTGGQMLTLRISDLNLQLVNGMEGTSMTNGLGNLILGYALAGSVERTGSHNIVNGTDNGYTSFGGYVGGTSNRIEAPHAVVLSGSSNRATGSRSVICSGSGNDVEVDFAFVGTGSNNRAGSTYSSILGGAQNDAVGFGAAVSGGLNNRAEGQYSSISGGCDQTVSQLCEHAP